NNVKLPDFGIPEKETVIPNRVYEERCKRFYEAAKCDWIIVYGDREHFGNLFYLTGFDPRFEEALLVIGPVNSKYLLVGNEGVDHSHKANVDAEVLLCPPFSLMVQERSKTPRRDNIVRGIGRKKEAIVGVCALKYLEEAELITGASNIF